MKQRLMIGVVLVLVGIGGVLVWQSLQANEDTQVAAQVINAEDLGLSAVGFMAVDGKYDWSFPDDFGPHPNFQREQWQISSVADCPIQLTLTFERLSLLPEQLMPSRDSAWTTQSIFSAQATIRHDDNVELETALISRGALGLVGATDQRVWVEDWVLDFADNTLFIRSDSLVLSGDLLFEDPRDPMIDDTWYSYQRPAEMRGQLITDENIAFTCAMLLVHRFGSTA